MKGILITAGLLAATAETRPTYHEGLPERAISFDLRLIYLLADGDAIREDLERIMAERGVEWTLMQGDAKPGAKYGRHIEGRTCALVRTVRGSFGS